MNVLIILFVVILIVALIFYFKAHRPVESPIQCYSGRCGSGKTFNMTIQALKYYRKSVFQWWLCNKSILKWTKKSKRHELRGKAKPKLYSNYPIIIKKTRKGLVTSSFLDIGFLDNTKPFEDGSILVLDEFSQFLSQFVNIKDKDYTNTLKNISDNLTLFRHYHSNYSHLLVSSQCTNEINYVVRYKLNQSICFDSTKHYFKLFHISKYRVVDLTDNIKTIDETNTDNNDLNDKYCTIFNFGRCKNYDNRCYSNRYCKISNEKPVDSPLKIETLCKPTLNMELNDILKTYDFTAK